MNNNYALCILFFSFSVGSCYTTQKTLSSSEDVNGLSWGQKDSTLIDSNHDGSGHGVFGRKIIYRVKY